MASRWRDVALSLTRRDGPDNVRNGSTSKKRPPPTSSHGDESRRWRKKDAGVARSIGQ